MPDQQITLIGCGKMGSAMLEGWLEDASLNAHFVVVEPNQNHLSQFLEEPRVKLYRDCYEAVADDVSFSTMIVLAVKPQKMDEALIGLGGLRDSRSAFLSIAAGISIDWFRQRLGADATVMRAMPNTPAAIGQGITALYSDAGEDSCHLAHQLLSSVGDVVFLDSEGLMDAVTAVSGSGPAYVFLLVEAMSKAGVDVGLPDELAKRLAKATVCGAAALMAAGDTPPAILRENVTSKGGTTAAALSVLMTENALFSLMKEAVEAAKARSVALGE